MRRVLLVIFFGLVLGGAYLYGVIGWKITQPHLASLDPVPPPSNAHRIAIFGTSLTSRGVWVTQLEAELQKCNPDVTITAISRPGASSRWGNMQLQDAFALLDTPYDITIIEFSGNDASLKNGFPLWISHRLHREMIETAQASGSSVYLATMSPAWGVSAWIRPGQDRYHALYRDLARHYDTGLIDTIPNWRALPDDLRMALVPDGLHPTGRGMERITVPAFKAALRSHVCEGSL